MIGIDWISVDDDVEGVLGQFRGIPNLVTPVDGGYFHPGVVDSISTLVAEGPVKATVQVVTSDDSWRQSGIFIPIQRC